MSLGPDAYTIIERLTSKLVQAIDVGATIYIPRGHYSFYLYGKMDDEYMESSSWRGIRSVISLEMLKRNLSVALNNPLEIDINFNDNIRDSEIYKWWVNLKNALGENIVYSNIIVIDPIKTVNAYANY